MIDQENDANNTVITKLKRHYKWFYIFFDLSVLGIINNVPHPDQYTGGFMAWNIANTSNLILGPAIASIINITLHVLFSLSIIWIIITIAEYRIIRKLKREYKISSSLTRFNTTINAIILVIIIVF